jgi:F-type H+-transporting ATPase subunit b
LGAEAEGKRRSDEAKSEAERVMEEAKRKFTAEAERRRAQARDQAKTILETARSGADAEAQQILDQGKNDRERMTRRFSESEVSVVDGVLAEFVEHLLRGRSA